METAVSKMTELRVKPRTDAWPFDPPNMSVHDLSAAQLRAAILQLVSSPGFGPNNPQLSAAETAAIRTGVWPAKKPVFTPYAITHHGYSQSKSPHLLPLPGY